MYTADDFAYKWGDVKLLNELLRARHRGDQEDATYLYGAVVARMKGFVPLFQSGDKVQAKGETVFISFTNSNLTIEIRGSRRKFSGIVTVEKIYYVPGNGKWEIVFSEKTPETTFTVIPAQEIPLRFMAEDFTIITGTSVST